MQLVEFKIYGLSGFESVFVLDTAKIGFILVQL